MSSNVLTTHAGSLPRPASLDALWARHSRGEQVDASELEADVEAATAAIVAKQIEIGLDIINDGEQGRESFFTFVRDRFGGFGGRGDRRNFSDMFAFPSYLALKRAQFTNPESVSLGRLPAVVGPLVWKGDEATRVELSRFGALANAGGAKGTFVTAPSPGIVATGFTNRHYGSMSEYVSAIGDGLANDYRAVIAAGHELQIDAPDLAMERHTFFAGQPLDAFLEFARMVVDAINISTTGLPPERIRLHVCWGNYDGPHCFDVPFEDIAPVLLEANVGSLVISLANPRHSHEVALLRDLPHNVSVVAGVIDTTTNYVEHPRVVAERIERVVEMVGDAARVRAGTDCGFATAAGMKDVADEVVWLKLASLVEGARLANGT